jgi:HEXXH motif-containing protein
LGLAPSASRVDSIDRTLRARLADSLRYLGEVASLDVSRQAALEKLEARLRSVPVSPWVFGLYAKLVAALSKTPRGDVGGVFDAVTQAASLPAEEGVVAFRDPAVPTAWWDHFRLLLDTDRKRPFNPQAPNAEAFALCRQEVKQALAFFERADPVWHGEVARLLRIIVLGSPQSAEVRDLFNGASTFFMWGATLINANVRRTAVSITDLLVHESSHVLLFGFSAEGALTRNSGEERYASPLRSDARPIDGIFHACFVATRVHLAMSRLLASGRLTVGEAKQCAERRDFNGNAARTALDVLAQNAKPTELGEEILGTIRGYWAATPSG